MIEPSLINRLKSQHHSITFVIEGLNDQKLSNRYLKDKWSIHEHIAHLGRYQVVFIDRIQMILINECPKFERYNAEQDNGFASYCARTTSELLEEINYNREVIYSLITTIPVHQLKRDGVHSKFGNLNVVDWTEFFLLHEAHHIYAIFQLRHTIK